MIYVLYAIVIYQFLHIGCYALMWFLDSFINPVPAHSFSGWWESQTKPSRSNVLCSLVGFLFITPNLIFELPAIIFYPYFIFAFAAVCVW